MKKLLTILLFVFTLHSGAQNIWYAPSVFNEWVNMKKTLSLSTGTDSLYFRFNTGRWVANYGSQFLSLGTRQVNVGSSATNAYTIGAGMDNIDFHQANKDTITITFSGDTAHFNGNHNIVAWDFTPPLPGGGGYWAANGNDIYNTNSGNVGIGTASNIIGDNKLTVVGGFFDSVPTTYGYSAIHCGAFNIGLPKEGIYATNGYSRLQMTYDEDQPNKTNWHWVLGSEKSKIEGDSTASSGYGTGELRMKFTDGDSYYFDGGSFYSFSGIGTLGNTDNHWFGLYTDGLKLTDGTQANGYVLTSDGSGNASWQVSPNAPTAGSFTQTVVAQTTFTVTIGVTEPNNTYKVNASPTNALSSALFYITNKTTTTFDVVYLAGLTGAVAFDWAVFQ